MCGYVCPIHRPRCCGICSNRPHQREARVCGVTAVSDPMASSQYSQTWLHLASAYTLCRVHSSYLGTLNGKLLIEQRRRRLPYRTNLQSRLEVNSFTRNPFRAQYREKYSKIFPYAGLRNGIRATGQSDVTETTSGQQTHATDRPCIPGGRKVQYQLRLHVRGGQVTSSGWQVTLCDSVWRMTVSVAVTLVVISCELLYSVFSAH